MFFLFLNYRNSLGLLKKEELPFPPTSLVSTLGSYLKKFSEKMVWLSSPRVVHLSFKFGHSMTRMNERDLCQNQ